MDQHQVVANWKGNMYFEADAPGGMVKLDAAEDVGGQNKGNRSKPLMLVSLAGCTGMDIALLVQKMRIEVAGISIEVTGYLTDEHPKIYNRVHVLYTFKGDNVDREKTEKAVNLSFDKYCGVIAMFKSFAQVTKEIRYS
ncbi:MAG: OsmC family protein [Bacteroidetes bacterium]|nr:OsmC family protein [Bacteroidota bacterium]